MDIGIASARQNNTYNQTDALRQAESVLQNIATKSNNDKWTQIISIFKASVWYELALCFSEANSSLALKYSIKHNQSILYRRGSPTCWNSVAKGCCMLGALIYDYDKSLSEKCLQKAIEIARLANNNSLVYLIISIIGPGLPSQSTISGSPTLTLKTQMTPVTATASTLLLTSSASATSVPTDTKTVSGIFGSSIDYYDDDEDEDDENWDMEFGIETNMEHFSLGDNKKNSASNALRSQPSIPTQYKLSEKLLKPLPNVTNYMRTTHLYSLKTNEGHSFIQEQKFCEWLRTLSKRQYDRGGYKTYSLHEVMENHKRRLKDKIVFNNNYIFKY